MGKQEGQSVPVDVILAKELATYKANEAHLLASALGRVVLITGERILGTFDSPKDATKAGYKLVRPQTPFLVRRIVDVQSPVNVLSIARAA